MHTPIEPRARYSTEDLAEILGVSVKRIHNLRSAGQLPIPAITGRQQLSYWGIDIENYLIALTEKGSAIHERTARKA